MFKPQKIEEAKRRLAKGGTNPDEHDELTFVAYGYKVAQFVRGNSVASFLDRENVTATVCIGEEKFQGVFNHEDYARMWEFKTSDGRTFYFEEGDFIGGYQNWKDYKIEFMVLHFKNFTEHRERIVYNWSLTSSCL